MKNLCISVAVVLVSIIAFNACTKLKVPLAFPDNYISKMGGTRYWHGTDIGVETEQITADSFISTPYSYILNYTFALQLSGLTASSSYFGQWGSVGGTFTYKSSDTSSKSLVFISNSGSEMRYYYLEDSIIISGGYGGIHGHEHVYLRTP